MNSTQLEQVVIMFAGDSGDGMQFTGSQFTNTAAHIGNDISTFPDFPAEIRAPSGTVAGVSGFQLHFGSVDITSPGDLCDVLVAMNAAALKKNKDYLKPNGILIVDPSGFDKKNIRLAKCETEEPLKDAAEKFNVHEIPILKQTQTLLKDSGLSKKEIDRSKNMFALGFVYWLYNRPLDFTLSFLESKFQRAPEILKANTQVLRAGYNYGEITDAFTERFEVAAAEMPAGSYRNISGNQALGLGLISASKKSNLPLFYGGYPITPASDILHFLAKYKQLGIKTFQAEDEIAAIGACIGASFGGNLAVTASSGPGIALKTEALGLALMLELPMVVVNVQRGGPSTGLPTKTEQADLLQAVYGRNGESPVPVLAAKTPSDCFNVAFEACRIAIEHMTPVILLSDGYLANGAEPWRYPDSKDLSVIQPRFASTENSSYLPYARDEKLVREWAIPGMKNLEHRVGGLEKEDLTGNVSYNPQNHEKMVKLRKQKIENIADTLPEIATENHAPNAKVLILGWGSTYGAIKAAVNLMADDQIEVAHAHLTHLCPFPKNLGSFLAQFTHVIVPELNQGQLVKLIREQFLIDAQSLCKTQGIPLTAQEIYNFVKRFV